MNGASDRVGSDFSELRHIFQARFHVANQQVLGISRNVRNYDYEENTDHQYSVRKNNKLNENYQTRFPRIFAVEQIPRIRTEIFSVTWLKSRKVV